MSQSLAHLLAALSSAELAAFSRYEQCRTDWHQREAAKAQREADAARKEVKRRAAISKKETPA